MSGTGDQFQAGPFTYAPRYDPGRQHPRPGYGYVPGYGGYVPFGYSFYVDPADYIHNRGPERSEREPEGRLLLTVSPGSAQVFVDGFYFGVVDDARERGVWLGAGPHRVELRAEGYETATFDVRIAEGDTVHYRKALAVQSASPEATRRVAATPKVFYVIRGCYAGDSRPDAARLPAGCRAADVRVIPPVVSPSNR